MVVFAPGVLLFSNTANNGTGVAVFLKEVAVPRAGSCSLVICACNLEAVIGVPKTGIAQSGCGSGASGMLILAFLIPFCRTGSKGFGLDRLEVDDFRRDKKFRGFVNAVARRSLHGPERSCIDMRSTRWKPVRRIWSPVCNCPIPMSGTFWRLQRAWQPNLSQLGSGIFRPQSPKPRH
jgi:hypothetical protein